MRRRGAHTLVVYPRLLRDRSVMPSIDIAIQHFESMLGHERRELDPSMFSHFFGDHKLARCIVACLGRSYRFRRRTIDELVTRAAARRLTRGDLREAPALRLHVYDRVNEDGAGYLPTERRIDLFGSIERELRLRTGELERLLYLDADEHAILERVGPTPTPEDIVAQYNLRVVESLLRHAELIELELGAAVPPSGVAALCERGSVPAEITRGGGGLRVRVPGHQDSLGSWSRHGRRVFRALVSLIQRAGGGVTDGSALVALRARKVQLALNREILDLLAGFKGSTVEDDDWDLDTIALSPARARGTHRPGVTIVRAPDIQAWAAGVLVPDLEIRRGNRGVFVCFVRSRLHAGRLATLASHVAVRDSTIFVGRTESLDQIRDAGAHVVELGAADRGWLDAVVERAAGLAIAA